VLARFARNTHLADACHLWAFSAVALAGRPALLRRPPGSWQDAPPGLRQLGNRLVGILHTCLERRELYREEVAWPALEEVAA
jgi:hypothetical protein